MHVSGLVSSFRPHLAGSPRPGPYAAGMNDTRSELLDLLGSGCAPTQAEAARRLGLSERSARRHLRRLEAEGLVEVRRDGLCKRYVLRLEHRPLAPVPIRLTEGEAEALTVAVLAARDVLAPTPFAAPLAAAHEKLERAWLAEAFSFEPESEPGCWRFDDVLGGVPEPFDRGCFAALIEAVRNRRPVCATYYTASRQRRSEGRRLHPLGFLIRAGAWMVVAFDPGAPDAGVRVKDFALAGFETVHVLRDETFCPPAGFDLTLHARDRFRALAGAEPCVVRLLVEPEAAPYFSRKKYHPTQQIEDDDREDGRVVVSFDVEGLDDVAAWVLSWGPKLRVLEPAELAERVAASHRAAAERYAAPPQRIQACT